MRLLLTLVLTLTAGTAAAHHGSNGQFNHDIKIDVTGVITSVKVVNPHSYVYFDVTTDGDDVQEWRCEMQGTRSFNQKGWTAEMFATGTQVAVTGSQARREEFGCYMDTISFDGGPTLERGQVLSSPQDQPITEVELAKGIPVINGRWESAVPTGGARRTFVPADSAVAAESAAWPTDVPVTTGRASYAVSAAGKAATSDFSREMNPRFNCEATNLFHDWTFSQTVNKIDQSDDKIVITYGFMDIVRTIHLDMDSHPDNITPSRAGHSIGKWQGDTLMVDTIGFKEGWLAALREGIKHSDQMHVVETFNLSEDGEWLVMTYTINDPLYLEAPYTGQLTQGKTGEPFTPYDCVELTEERVDGF